MNTSQKINTNNKIKFVFGNHNALQLFMRYITNNTDLLIIPPFSPVMARIHQALMRKLSNELITKYPLYTSLSIYNFS